MANSDFNDLGFELQRQRKNSRDFLINGQDIRIKSRRSGCTSNSWS